MNTVGIVAEYNPFHNGHKYHLEESKKQTNSQYSICVMSGNFTQRGEPAVFDKWTRASIAVQNGVDLVIELPTVFAVNSAEFFAGNAVRLLNALGIVNSICFGAENADLPLLTQIANAENDKNFSLIFQKNLHQGISYPSALCNTIHTLYSIDKAILNEPNNILAIEYLKAIEKFNCKINPFPLKRAFANYHDTEILHEIASATSIRKYIYSNKLRATKKALSSITYDIIKAELESNRSLLNLDNFSTLILPQLFLSNSIKLSQIAALSEGLENKLIKTALHTTSITQLLSTLKTKRYPLTRLQRIIIQIMLNITKPNMDTYQKHGPLYARILAFNTNGRKLLKILNTTCSLPIIIKTAEHLNSAKRAQHNLSLLEEMLAIDTYATDLYTFFSFKTTGLDFTTSPYYHQN